jgi:HSP20 family protein
VIILYGSTAKEAVAGWPRIIQDYKTGGKTMTKMVTYDPFLSFDTLFDDIFYKHYDTKAKTYKDGQDLVVEALLPGLRKEDVSVDINDSVLTIKSEKTTNKEGKSSFYNKAYKFSRSYILDEKYDAEGCKAELKDGILTVRLPDYYKEVESKTKHIKVELK